MERPQDQGYGTSSALLGICTEFARSLSEGSDPQAVLEPFLVKIDAALGAVGIAVWEPDPTEGFLKITAYAGLPEAYVIAGNETSRSDAVSRALSPVYRTFEQQEVAAYTGLLQPEHPFSEHAKRIGGDALYVIPVGREDMRLGVVALYVGPAPALGPQELLDWSAFVAQQVGVALYLKHLAREAAVRDELAAYRVQKGLAAQRDLLGDLALLTGNLLMVSERGTLRDPMLGRETLATLRRTIKAYLELANLVMLDPDHMPLTPQATGLRTLLEAALLEARQEGAAGELRLVAAGEVDFQVLIDSGRMRSALATFFAAILPCLPQGLRIDLAPTSRGGVRLSLPELGQSPWEALCVPLRAVVEAHGGRLGRLPEGGIWLELPGAARRLDP